MAKLSHIEDVERRREQQAAQDAASLGEPSANGASHVKEADTPPPTDADREEAFHGIDAGEPLGVGHRFLIILAVLVTLAAILYIVNSWLHFI